jgi:UDP-4-amino-4,6-dideoxy-N-acetyl-beta-L-altrosamine transaminase
MIPYARQDITKKDIEEVKKILNSNFLTQGPIVPKFEKIISKYCGVNYAVAVNSATSALHISCLALGLGNNDWLWTSPNSFVASANCGLYCGANIDFVDINPKTYNLNISSLIEKLKRAKKAKRLPKVVVPVHFAGQPSDMKKIYQLSKKYKFKILEDASHAIGASYEKHKVGSCKYSDITVFSFHPVKIITTGEGGMALTNNKKIFKKIKRLSSHGITRDKNLMIKRSKGEIWNYQQIELGFNYRMTDIQAALGLSQFKRLNKYVKKRNRIAKFYYDNLKNLDIQLPYVNKNIYSSYHLYPIRIKKNIIKKTQKKVFELLLKKKIQANLLYAPIHRHPFYEKIGFKENDFPESEKFHKDVVCIPMYPKLTQKQLKIIVSSIKKILIQSK